MLRPRISTAIILVLLLAISGCASRADQVVPRDLQSQVDRTIAFNELKESPDSYQGRVVVLGGEVLSAKRLKDGTRIEVLQLPLSDSQDPVYSRTSSQGRFMAVQKEFLDPAKLPPGTRVTITGEVTGSLTQPIDEAPYTYPTLDVKSLMVWPDIEQYRTRPYYPYYPGLYPYWGGPFGRPWGWGGWGAPYWW